MLARWGPGGARIPGTADGDFHLWVFNVDGSGDKGDGDAVTGLYIDGSQVEADEDGAVNGLTGSIQNDHDIWIGRVWGQGGAFNGEIGFIEVHYGDLPGGATAAEYGLSRYNGGNPSRVPEPGTLALLGLGDLMVLARRRVV